MQGRAEIQNAPDDTMRAIQEARHRNLESEVSPIRVMGDAVISAFFAADKTKAREKARADVESQISGHAAALGFARSGGGKAARGRTPASRPFIGRSSSPRFLRATMAGSTPSSAIRPFSGHAIDYRWRIREELSRYGCESSCTTAHGNADLVAHFFRRGFGLLRAWRVSWDSLLLTLLRQGDTRRSGLAPILGRWRQRYRAPSRRLRWPGDAAVVVSVVHIDKDPRVSRSLMTCGRLHLLLIS